MSQWASFCKSELRPGAQLTGLQAARRRQDWQETSPLSGVCNDRKINFALQMERGWGDTRWGRKEGGKGRGRELRWAEVIPHDKQSFFEMRDKKKEIQHSFLPPNNLSLGCRLELILCLCSSSKNTAKKPALVRSVCLSTFLYPPSSSWPSFSLTSRSSVSSISSPSSSSLPTSASSLFHNRSQQNISEVIFTLCIVVP